MHIILYGCLFHTFHILNAYYIVWLPIVCVCALMQLEAKDATKRLEIAQSKHDA